MLDNLGPIRDPWVEGQTGTRRIHSRDLVRAFEHFFREPRVAEIYNIGGGRVSNASVLEAIAPSEQISGNELARSYEEANGIGDHIWWISSNERFRSHYRDWNVEYGVERILREIHDEAATRWAG